MTRSMKSALADLELAGLWVVYPGRTSYRLAEDVHVIPLHDIGATWDYDR